MPEDQRASDVRAKLQDLDVYRTVPMDVEERQEGEDTPRTIHGHFSIFDSPYEIRSWIEGHFMETIQRGAFEDTFREDGERIRLMLDHGHDPQVGDRPLGRLTRLEEDTRGAYYEGTLYDTNYVRELVPALQDGQYGASFRFRVEGEEWNDFPERTADNPNGLPVRTITKVRVMEVGPTVFGANPAATANVRSATDHYREDLALQARSRAESTEHNKDPNDTVEGEPAGGSADVDEPDVRHEETSVKDNEVPSNTDDSNKSTRSDDVDDTVNSDKKGQTMSKNLSIEERRARVDEIDERQAALDEQYGDDPLSDEDQSKYDELESERSEHTEAIEEAERKEEERKRKLEERKAAIRERSERGSVERPGRAPAVNRKPENVYDVDEVRKDARSHEDFVRRLNDNAKRIVSERDYEGSDVDAAKNQEAVSKLLARKDNKHGELSQRIMNTGSDAYKRAFAKYLTSKGMVHLEPDETRAMSLGTDSEGGFKVPFDLDPSIILTSDGVVNPVRQMARNERIVGKTWQGVSSAGVTLDIEGEAEEVDEDDFTMARLEANTRRVSAFVPYSIELDESDSGLISDLTMVIQDARDTREAAVLVNGDGDGLTGIQGISGGLAAGSIINTETDTEGFGVEDLYALVDDLPPRHDANGSFLANKATYNAVRQFGNNDGHALWERLGPGRPNELLGYPAREASEMANSDVEDGNPFLILGDFRKYLVVDRIGMVMDVIPHVLGASNRPTGERALVAYWWFGGLILDHNAFRGLQLDAEA